MTDLNDIVVLPEGLADRRQSEAALTIARGAGRLLRRLGFSALAELSLPSGRRADLVAVNARGEIWIVEIKSSLADFRADRKWPEYRSHSDRLYFACAPDMPNDCFPDDAGLILADAFGGHVLRDAPEHRMAAATRKAMMIRIAMAGAGRLGRLADPGGPHQDW